MASFLNLRKLFSIFSLFYDDVSIQDIRNSWCD